jgi:protein-histidine pros-kinase
MDDYLAKPVRQDALSRTLRRWLDGPKESVTTQTAPGDEPGKDTALESGLVESAEPHRGPDTSDLESDRQSLDPEVARSLRKITGADQAAFWEMVEAFLENTRNVLGGIEKDLENGDLAALRERAHSVKGSVGMYGANALLALFHELEQKARTGSVEDVDALIQETHSEFQRLGKAYLRYLEKN